ncbi:MAG: SDR family oxidoreductase [Opitutaceae bacterium]|nr:SDR family oxidoreductase [Opitutaceae bacterium]
MNLIVTGGAAGLGRVIATAFAREGANVFILDRDPADATIDQLSCFGVRTGSSRCDVTNEHDVVAGVRAAAAWCDGAIDILVNNAGFNGVCQLVKDMKLEDWNRTFAINITGTMLVTREVLRHMEGRRSGRICNLSSNVGRRGLPYRGDYVCTKWAMLGLTQTLALELAPLGIRVNAVCPGPIEGDRIEQVMDMHAAAEGRTRAEVRLDWEQAAPMGRFAKPEEVAALITFLCSDESSCMTGQGLNATCGFIMT